MTTVTKFSRYLVLLAITFLVSGYSPPLASQIDDMLTKLAEQDLFSGSVLVAKDGEVLISKGYGMANIELEAPNTPQTKFRIGSITKQFTAMAILQLQQEGKLNVNDPICQYIEDCPEAWEPVTIRQLLTHTSGIYNFTNASSYPDFKMQHASPAEIIEQFRDLPLDFPPGETWSYSNSGYILLGYIIEDISGQSYAGFLKDNIFEPLQMADTGYDNNGDVIKNRASGYSSKRTNADYIDMSVVHAAGGLYSTVEDLFLWDQALYTDTLIPTPLREEMFTPLVQIPDTEVSYGYGWLIDTQLNHKRISHSGGIEGFVTEIDRYPNDEVVIIVLSNLERALPDAIALGIAKVMFGEE
jgi:CubicO group peptidase (beta-lactamase class C family)